MEIISKLSTYPLLREIGDVESSLLKLFYFLSNKGAHLIDGNNQRSKLSLTLDGRDELIDGVRDGVAYILHVIYQTMVIHTDIRLTTYLSLKSRGFYSPVIPS